MGTVSLRPYQEEARKSIENEWEEGRRKTLLVLPTGCHAKGEHVLLSNGQKEKVENIVKGDELLGADGRPRTVLATHKGIDDLYKVTPVKGEPFIVNSAHKLSLVQTNQTSNPKYKSEMTGGSIVDATVGEWFGWSKWKKHIHKLYRSGAIEKFPHNDGSSLTIDPYFLGVLLGDGDITHGVNITTMDCEVKDAIQDQANKYGYTIRREPSGKAETFFLRSGEKGCKGGRLTRQLKMLGLFGSNASKKHVPAEYRTAPLKQRLEVIAGLIDTDGSLHSCSGYDFVSKSKDLSEDIAFMCRSAGLAAYVSKSTKSSQNGYTGTYWRVSISGDCSVIPCRVEHKKARERKQVKNVLRTGFSVEHVGKGEYFGFTVDGDNRYLLHDFTVTHNCGKTIVFSMVAKDQVDKGERVLILAHRGELLEQAADKLKAATGLGASVEKAEQTSLDGWYRVTVGSVQTLMREKRLKQFSHDYYDTIIVDEAHHSLAGSYQTVLDYFGKAKVLGVTATADRGDRKNLGAYFDSIAYEYTLPRAIREGYLSPIKAQTIPLQLDLTKVKITSGDFSANDVGTALDPYLGQIAEEMLAAGCMDRKTVVFLPLVATSKKFKEILGQHGFNALEVNGESKDRKEVLEEFDNAAPGAVLCNSMLLTEGWDCPSVNCVVVLRPTKVRSLYVQMVGRGTRLSPETGKTDLLVLDFLWMTQRHDLCHPAHLIADTPEVAEAMTARIKESAAPLDLEEVEHQAKEDVVTQREEALAEQLKEMRTRKRKLVDPLQFEMSIQAEDLVGWEPTFDWEMAPASEKQLEALEKFGIYPDEVECAGKASLLLDKLNKRRKEGYTTPKQIRLLEGKGFQHVGSWSFEAAHKLINRIAASGWRVPRGIDPGTYRPEEGML